MRYSVGLDLKHLFQSKWCYDYWINCDPTWCLWRATELVECKIQATLPVAEFLDHSAHRTFSIRAENCITGAQSCRTSHRIIHGRVAASSPPNHNTPPGLRVGFHLAKFRCLDWELRGGFAVCKKNKGNWISHNICSSSWVPVPHHPFVDIQRTQSPYLGHSFIVVPISTSQPLQKH